MGKVAVRNVYIDYLLSTHGPISTYGPISATGLSEVIENQYSHDKINRVLYHETTDDKSLYRQGKRLLKTRESKGKKR